MFCLDPSNNNLQQQQQEHAGDEEARQLAERLAWVRQMRGAFSPEGICRPDGQIDQDFFKPKNIIIRLKDDEKWGPAQREALYKVGGCCLTRGCLLLMPCHGARLS